MPACEVKGPEKVEEAVPETTKLVVLAVPETVSAVVEAYGKTDENAVDVAVK